MAKTPAEHGEDTRPLDERQTALLATALFSKRADGHFSPISPTEAAQLLGEIDSYSTGQGAYNVLVPVRAVEALGLNTALWGKSANMRNATATLPAQYDLDYLTGVELIGRLQVVSGKSWAQQRELKTTIDASRGDRNLG